MVKLLNIAFHGKEGYVNAVVDNALDAIITISEAGIIESFNPAALRIFGYSLEEIVGENIRILMPEPNQGRHDGYLRRYLTTGESRFLGVPREVIAQRKGGGYISCGNISKRDGDWEREEVYRCYARHNRQETCRRKTA